MANELAVKYTVGDEEIQLDEATVRNYLVTGKQELVTKQEIMLYMKLCKVQGLNPFLKDAYLIKYGADQPAQMIVGKDAFTKRADEMPECRGWVAGVCVTDKNGEYLEREGSVVLPNEKLVGGWCSIEKDGWSHPFKHTVSLEEYHTHKSTWNKMPATMIRKVALVQGLRDAFPSAFQGMYDSAEIDSEAPKNTPSSNNAKEAQNPAKPGKKRTTAAKDNVIDIAPKQPEEEIIGALEKKAISELLTSEEKVAAAKKILSGYGYESIKGILKADFDDIYNAIEANCAEIDSYEEMRIAQEINEEEGYTINE